jgi:hypothetical protein
MNKMTAFISDCILVIKVSQSLQIKAKAALSGTAHFKDVGGGR